MRKSLSMSASEFLIDSGSLSRIAGSSLSMLRSVLIRSKETKRFKRSVTVKCEFSA